MNLQQVCNNKILTQGYRFLDKQIISRGKILKLVSEKESGHISLKYLMATNSTSF